MTTTGTSSCRFAFLELNFAAASEMTLKHLWLTDFRCFESAEFVPTGNVTVIKGANGTGKTSILEAVGLAATMRSFRAGEQRESLVRIGARNRGHSSRGGRIRAGSS